MAAIIATASLLQRFINYYASVYIGFSAAGDLSVVVLLAVVLLRRPQGLLGRSVG